MCGRESECVLERESECGRESVCAGRESVCVGERVFGRECVWERVCVCVGESVCVWESESVCVGE